uniref:Uncharacterized protein n=1 Tax=Anopheles merus TaxID=30066 RepID=A0A182VIW1_ANOME
MAKIKTPYLQETFIPRVLPERKLISKVKLKGVPIAQQAAALIAHANDNARAPNDLPIIIIIIFSVMAFAFEEGFSTSRWTEMQIVARSCHDGLPLISPYITVLVRTQVRILTIRCVSVRRSSPACCRPERSFADICPDDDDDHDDDSLISCTVALILNVSSSRSIGFNASFSKLHSDSASS